MKKGLLIYNRNDAKKNRWFIRETIKKASSYFLDIELVYADDLREDVQSFTKKMQEIEGKLSDLQFVLLRCRETFGFLSEIRCFNCDKLVKLANDKGATYDFVKSHGIEVLDYCTIDLDAIFDSGNLQYPFVIKPAAGHGGEGVFLVNDEKECLEKLEEIKKIWPDEKSVVFQKCASDVGKDLRVYTLGGKILASVLREGKCKEDIRANFSLGGRCRLHKLSDMEMDLLDKVLSALEADGMRPDFAGIDFIYDNGRPVFNEIEDAVGSRMLYQLTDIDVISEYLSWVADSVAGD